MAILTTRYNSMSLGGYVSFTAIIPYEDFGMFPNFNPNPYEKKEPLKTLYLLHGITGDEKDWLYNSNIARYAEEHNMAIIMPDGNNNFYVDNNASDRWGEFIGKELVAVTRGLFPLSEKREDTYIGGLSMGGYGAIRNGLKYSETFSKIIALSSALITYEVPYSNEEAPLPSMRRSGYERVFGPVDQLIGSDMDPEWLYANKTNDVKLFMAIGTDDFLIEHNRRYKAFLEEQNADLYYFEEAGAHEWDFWNRNIKRGLTWLCE